MAKGLGVGVKVANTAVTGTNSYSWTLTDPRGCYTEKVVWYKWYNAE